MLDRCIRGLPVLTHPTLFYCSILNSFPKMGNQPPPPQATIARVAIVTGAAQGIGEAIALRLADDGIDVVLNDLPRKSDQLDGVVKAIQAKGRRAAAVLGDATVEADVIALVDTAVKEFGGLDIVRRAPLHSNLVLQVSCVRTDGPHALVPLFQMIANAGTVGVRPLVDMTVEDWDRVMGINVRSVMLAYKHAARQMIKQGRGGRIVGALFASCARLLPTLIHTWNLSPLFRCGVHGGEEG